MSRIFDNWNRVQDRIQAAAERSGRRLEDIEVVAVTKYAPIASVTELLKSGKVRHIGENRVQEAAKKFDVLAEIPEMATVQKHMIGHLQTNKARQALEIFDTLDSLDSMHLAETLNSRLKESDRVLPVLIQARLTDRATQSGVEPEQVGDLIERCRNLKHLSVRGLMVIAPQTDPLEAVRPYFKRMKDLLDESMQGVEVPRILSMGMSRDFEIAVEEGATMVRLGSVLFT